MAIRPTVDRSGGYVQGLKARETRSLGTSRALRRTSQRPTLLVAAGLSTPGEHALISLFALTELKVFEGTRADIEHPGLEPRHRTLIITRKGAKVVTTPLAPRTVRPIDLATGERCDGPIFLTIGGAGRSGTAAGGSSAG